MASTSWLRTRLLVVAVLSISNNALHAETSSFSAEAQFWPLIITPLLSGAVAIIGAFVAIRFDARKTINQELIKKRILIYDAMAPKLNDLLCFFLLRGTWKSLTPPLMIQRKRELDQTAYVYGPLFSQAAFERYNAFMHLCFKTFTGVGRDACLRANHNRLRREWGADWKPEWDHHFVASDTAKNQDVMREYNSLLTLLAMEIGARHHPVHSKTKTRAWWRRLMQRS